MNNPTREPKPTNRLRTHRKKEIDWSAIPDYRPDSAERRRTIYEKHFRGLPRFDAARFAKVPWVVARHCIDRRVLTMRAFQMYVYIASRCGNDQGLFAIADEDMVAAMGFDLYEVKSKYKKELVRKGLIKIAQDGGKQYIFLPDPEPVVKALILERVAKGELPRESAERLHRDLVDTMKTDGLPGFE